MSRIVFFGFMAQGHTNPTLGVVQELVSRGHRVRYYSFEPFREAITAAGAEFIPCDSALPPCQLSPKDQARISKDLVLSTKLLADATLALDGTLFDDLRAFRPDCVVADSMALWGKAAACKLGIPFVSSITTFAFNQHVAKTMHTSSGGLFSFLRAMPKAQKEIKRLQEQGYPIKNVLDILQSDKDAHAIVYTSPEFQPSAETFPDRFAFVGPSVRPAVSTYEKTRERLIYLSMGTVNNRLLPLYQSCIDAFSLKPYQVVMAVGDQADLSAFGTLPPNITVLPSVDQMAVLQQADVFISHCGMNSASESLYCGVPLVVLPQTEEQQAVANRILHFYAGVRPVREDGLGICAAAESIFLERNFYVNANILAQQFKRCPGAKGAADKIESVCLENPGK